MNTKTTHSHSTSACSDSTPDTTSPPVKIWVVDDNDQIRSLLLEGFAYFEGIECVREFDSPNALLSTLASKPGPDLILLDIQMGELNGLDAVRPIRSLSRSTRVVMFTSTYSAKRKKRAMADGASDFLLKHDPLEYVVDRIRQLACAPPPKVARRRVATPDCNSRSSGHSRRRLMHLFTRARAGGGAPDRHLAPSARAWKRYLEFFRGRRDREAGNRKAA